MVLDIPGGSVFVEGTLCHPGEDVDHRVDPVLLVPVREGHHLYPVGEEGSVEEFVQQNYLS